MNKKNFKEVWFATHARKRISYRSEEDKLKIDEMMAEYRKLDEAFKKRMKAWKDDLDKGYPFRHAVPTPPYYPPIFVYVSYRDETDSEWNARFEDAWLDTRNLLIK